MYEVRLYVSEYRGMEGIEKVPRHHGHGKSLEHLGLGVFAIGFILWSFFDLMATAVPCIYDLQHATEEVNKTSELNKHERKIVTSGLMRLERESEVNVALCVLKIIFICSQVRRPLT